MTIECPKCKTKNPDKSKFCMECATPLPGVIEATYTKTVKADDKGLIPETLIAEKYKIIEVLGKGGMSIYLQIICKFLIKLIMTVQIAI